MAEYRTLSLQALAAQRDKGSSMADNIDYEKLGASIAKHAEMQCSRGFTDKDVTTVKFWTLVLTTGMKTAVIGLVAAALAWGGSQLFSKSTDASETATEERVQQ